MNGLNIGDRIQITLLNNKELDGIIKNIDDSMIVLNVNGALHTINSKFIGYYVVIENALKQNIPLIEPTDAEPSTKLIKSDVPIPEIVTTIPDASESSDISEKHPVITTVGSTLTMVPKVSPPSDVTSVAPPIIDATGKTSTNEIMEDRPQEMGLKIIGKIDVSSLESKAPGKKERGEAGKTAFHGKRFTTFNELKEILDAELEDEDFNIVAANGRIRNYTTMEGKSYGFINDSKKDSFYFTIHNVVDPELSNIISNSRHHDLPVVCVYYTETKGARARAVCLPKRCSDLIVLANQYFSRKEFKISNDLCDMILHNYPNYERALDLKKAIHNADVETASKTLYAQAIDEINNKNYTSAKNLLRKVIENTSDNADQAIKRFVFVCQQESKIEEAVNLVENNFNKLKYTNPHTFIAGLYEQLGRFDIAIRYFEKSRTETGDDLVKKYLHVALLYAKSNNISQAKQILKTIGNDRITKPIMDRIDELSDKSDIHKIEAVFDVDEFSSIDHISITPILKKIIDDARLEGISEKAISKNEFTKDDLEGLRDRYRTISNDKTVNTPLFRATLLLTEAKLIKEYNLDSEEKIIPLLSRYCIAIGQSNWIEGNSELLRIYYYELFRINKDPKYIIQPYIYYILSFGKLYEEVNRSKFTRDIGTNELMEFQKNGIADALYWMSPSEEVIKKIIEHTILISIHNKFIADLFIGQYKLFPLPIQAIFDNFIEKFMGPGTQREDGWKKCIEQYKDTINAWCLQLKSNSWAKKIEVLLDNISVIFKSQFPAWLPEIDKQRVAKISSFIRYTYDYLNASTYEDKERYRNIVLTEIENLMIETNSNPSKISFEHLLPVLDRWIILLNESFEDVKIASYPRLMIEILGDSTVLDQNIVPIQISVSNGKGCSPVKQLALTIENSDDVAFLPGENVTYETIRGGDNTILKVSIRVSEKVLREMAVNLRIHCHFVPRDQNNEKTFTESHTLRLYSENDFEIIENPFISWANGAAVEDKRMFYGRTQFIENLGEALLKKNSKCILLYGQKRSGKSSVLYHLKNYLNSSERAFSISFSMGEVIEGFSASVFFYKILTEIYDGLEHVPAFDTTSLKKLSIGMFKENPAIIFSESMKEIKGLFKTNPYLKERKIILLIDEFTYLYSAIQKDQVSDNFMKLWKSLIEKDFFSAVLIGQDTMPKFKLKFSNEFGITEDIRLTYLKEEDAKKLVIEPIWDVKRNISRFIGRAVEQIIELTAANPYYIQIFCARLVEYMNNKKAINVTEADVREVTKSFIKGSQALTIDKFDNLLSAGDAILDPYEAKDTLKILLQIAEASKNIGSCLRPTISIGDTEIEDQILNDLTSREVLVLRSKDNYKINVNLFQEWLVKN